MSVGVKSLVRVQAGSLVLVNAAHPLPLAVKPAGALLPALGSEAVRLESAAAKTLALCVETCGMAREVQAVSGYRTRAEQTALYAQSVRDNGTAFTAKYVARPGCSEHETGLAIDLGRAGEVDFIRPDLPAAGPFARLRRALPGYGFVLRYPADKTHITGIAHEPWHFRYVGWPHAGLVHAAGWVLEQYIDYLGACTGPETALQYERQGRRALVYTLREEEVSTAAELLAAGGKLWQMSGNNVDGVVVTQWL